MSWIVFSCRSSPLSGLFSPSSVDRLQHKFMNEQTKASVVAADDRPVALRVSCMHISVPPGASVSSEDAKHSAVFPSGKLRFSFS